jgi:hypothetical protein
MLRIPPSLNQVIHITAPQIKGWREIMGFKLITYFIFLTNYFSVSGSSSLLTPNGRYISE